MAMGSPGKMGQTAMSEINVTPLVDVMLVLLIIFMVTAPLMEQGVKVDLPQARGETMQADKEIPALTITKDGRYFLGKYEIPAAELEAKLGNNERLRRDKKINVYSDRGAPYGQVAQALAALHQAGIDSVGLVFETLEVQLTAEGPQHLPVAPATPATPAAPPAEEPKP